MAGTESCLLSTGKLSYRIQIPSLMFRSTPAKLPMIPLRVSSNLFSISMATFESEESLHTGESVYTVGAAKADKSGTAYAQRYS